jgi:protocatechuate 3,4-dioxygenase beta subunit
MTDHESHDLSTLLRRREALVLLGGAGAGALWHATRGADLARAAASVRTASAASTCLALSPEVTEGPYYLARHLNRQDITQGLAGMPLRLKLVVENHTTCKPIHGAVVEIWHANAKGIYSGFSSSRPQSTPDNSKRFLRGYQKSDAKGRVAFDTIYPGWYRGRAPHIHVKVHVGGQVVHVGQIFFPDTTSDAVYRTSAYKSHGQPDTTNAADGIYKQAGKTRAIPKLTRYKKHRGRYTHGYVGAQTLAVT